MDPPRISVIVPACEPARLLRWSIESVLTQTCQHFEILVVDRARSATGAEAVRCFDDSRIRHLATDVNGGTDLCIRRGSEASLGALVAVLEPGSAFHPEKLFTHVSFMEAHPEFDVTCNGRFEVDAKGRTLDLWRPPLAVTPSDLLAGLPLTPSEMVFRRETLRSADGNDVLSITDFGVRFAVAMAGFATCGVGRALNFRRSRCPSRPGDAVKSCEAEAKVLEAVFAQPSCPEALQPIREPALARAHLTWSHHAFLQGDIGLGRELIRKAIRFNRAILDMQGRGYLESLIGTCLENDVGHGDRIRQVLDCLPDELAWITSFRDWAIGRGYIERAIRAIIWDRLAEGRAHLARAAALGVELDGPYWHRLLKRLDDYEAERGPAATTTVVRSLTQHLNAVAPGSQLRWFSGTYFANQAFRHSRENRHDLVPGDVLRAAMSRPSYLVNRGLWAVLARSMIRSRRSRTEHPLVPHHQIGSV
jgi:hypothetical protein